MILARRKRLGLLCTVALLSSCGGESTPDSRCGEAGCPGQSCDNFDALRQPFFGDTHIHTSLSFDANNRGTRVGPEGAYRYARGEPVDAPPYDAQGNATRTIQIDRPLDFVVVSDHVEFLGAVQQCTDPAKQAYDHPDCEAYRAGGFAGFAALALRLTLEPEDTAYPDLCGQGAAVCVNEGLDVWQDSIDAAEAAHDVTSTCRFTALIGYEWSAASGAKTLHRNVVFRNSAVPELPAGYFEAPYVEDLWEALRRDCIDAETGCDALAIPHNSNMSGGSFFETTGRDGAIDANYAAERAFMEPIIEIFQHKGTSECKPGELISDELCGFEILPFDDPVSRQTNAFSDPSPKSFVRHAYGEGMKVEASLGANPFKLGIIASTDTHVSASGATSETEFPAHLLRDNQAPGLAEPYLGPGGLAGVWAEENSREALFLAMRRKETFGTSGPRIVVRFFGGWAYPDDACSNADLAQAGYDGGVAMGGDLPSRQGDASPTFIVSAMQDNGAEGSPGTPLQRLQVVKGWLDGDGEYKTEVFDVAGNADNGARVDLSTCEPDPGSGGFASLCTTWTDPAFDPSQRAYYYARVIENPTCRWSQRQCNAAGVDCSAPETVTEGFEECCDLTDDECAVIDIDCELEPLPLGAGSCCRPRVPKTIQERAWTSPIWYGGGP